MLPADLKDRVSAQLTPRRRRYGLVFLALFTVWSLFGLFALPGIIIGQAQKFVQEKLHLELSIGKLEFNPWLLAVRIDDLKLREPGKEGETLMAARSIYVNAQLWSSLWIRGASLDELDLLEPYINARLRKDGTLNLMQLVPPEDPEDTGEANWRVGTLGVHRGRIDIHDDTRPTPFSALFSPLNLALSDLSSRPDKDGGYTLHAETGEGETLDWHGTVAMKPVRSQGELKISRLKATTPWRYLQDQLPVIVDGGYISISGHYDLVADNGVTVALEKGQIIIDELALHQRGSTPLAISFKQLDFNGVNVKWPEQNAGFSTLTLKDFHISDQASGADLTRFNQLQLQNGLYTPTPQKFDLATVTLQQLVLTDAADKAALITLPALTLKKLDVALESQKAHVAQIILEKGDLSVRREKDGSLNWQTRLDQLSQRLSKNTLPATAVATAPEKPAPAVKGKKTAAGKAAKAAAEKPWQATLGELDLLAFRVGVEDLVPPGGVKTSLEDINLRIFPRLDGSAPHALEGGMNIGTGGQLAFKGSFSEQPLAAQTDLDLKGLKLPPFAPYFADVARFALESGSLDVAGKFSFAQAKTTKAGFNGRVAIQKFAANDLDQDQRFLAWNNLAINGINWQLAPGKLSIREVLADKPFIRVIIGQDKTINLSRILIAEEAPAAGSTQNASAEPAAAPKNTEPPYPLNVDRIRFKDGAMLFADFTLNPQFATGIQSLNGDISHISTDPKSRASVDLKGRVDQYGKADISGVINPVSSDLYTDIKVQFSNLELTTLTPYSAKFAGYRIDKGKLSMALNYKIEDRKLNASNKVVFNQLTLGEKVDSPDSIGLPLKLAVAILKDKNGVIDLDVPVTGSLDDPKFKVAPIIWKAFLNLLTKAATAPFTLIAGMVGGGDNMDAMIFPAGQTTLAPEETDKLNKLALALAERPALGVEIRGAFDPATDSLAVRTAKFDAVYLPRLGDSGKARKILEAMYKEKLGGEALEQQRALSLRPIADTAQNKEQLQLAEENYVKVLRNELIARETVLEGDLRQLALQRASAVRTQLVDVAKVDEARVFVLEPVTVQATDGKIVMKVGLTAQ